MRLNRHSFQHGVDARFRAVRIDFTKATADPGFADIVTLMGPRFAWENVIAACEAELGSKDKTPTPRRASQLRLGILNARAQLERVG